MTLLAIGTKTGRTVNDHTQAVGDIDVWFIPGDAVDVDNGRSLSAEERERADSLATPALASAFRDRHVILRRVLSGYVDCPPNGLNFSKTGSGKPHLGPGIGKSDLRFNMADSTGAVLIAVSTDAEVGVDIEAVRAVKDLEALARRYFHAAETAALLALDPALRLTAFLRCWTRKEAIMKADGAGMSLGLDRLDVGFAPLPPSGLEIDIDGRRFWVADLAVGDAYCASVALDAPIRSVRMRVPG